MIHNNYTGVHEIMCIHETVYSYFTCIVVITDKCVAYIIEAIYYSIIAQITIVNICKSVLVKVHAWTT